MLPYSRTTDRGYSIVQRGAKLQIRFAEGGAATLDKATARKLRHALSRVALEGFPMAFAPPFVVAWHEPAGRVVVRLRAPGAVLHLDLPLEDVGLFCRLLGGLV